MNISRDALQTPSQSVEMSLKDASDTVDDPDRISQGNGTPRHPLEKKKQSIVVTRLKRGQHYFNKWLDITTIHGIVHVFKGKSRLRRIIWLFVFLFASFGCVGIITYYIVHWARDPTTTTISVISSTDGQSFPAVTVCNLNAVKKDYADPDVVELLNTFATPTSGFIRDWPFSITNKSCIESLNDISNEDQRQTMLDAYTNGGYKTEDFVVYCGFAGSDGNIVRCEESLQPVFTSLGVCFTFNSAYSSGQPDRKVTLAGPQFGLNLVLNVNRSEYPRSSKANVGVKVSVHDRNSLPVPHQAGVTISPGTNSYLAIETVKNIDDTRESGCIRNNESLAFFPDYSYSVSTCHINALYEHYAQDSNCGCSPLTNGNTHQCTVADICCLSQERRTFNPTSSCPPSCEYLSYNVQPSYSEFIISEEDIRERNLVAVHVYYDNMLVTQLFTDYSYTFANLLADMGGLLGLFTGASVISLLEVCILIFDVVKSLLLTSRLNKVVAKLEDKINLPEVEIDEPSDY